VLHWNFETIDLAPFLRKEHNVIAAQVWNEGNLKLKQILPIKPVSFYRRYDEAQVLNTNDSWNVFRTKVIRPLKLRCKLFM